MLSAFNRFLSKALDWTIVAVHAALVAVLFGSVVARYVFDAPWFWSEEIAILAMIWMTFLGGAVLVRQDKNVCIAIFTDMMPPSANRVLRPINDLLVLLMSGVMVWLGWKLVGRLSLSTTPALRLSEGWFAGALLVGFIVMFYYQALRVVALFRGKQPFPETAERDGGECKL